MLNLSEIHNTIRELENGETTFATCQKLASLYIVRDHYTPVDIDETEEVSAEIDDILPAYQQYCKVKKRYQMQEVSQDSVIRAMHSVCTELKDLVFVIYANSDTEEERKQLKELLVDMTTKILEK